MKLVGEGVGNGAEVPAFGTPFSFGVLDGVEGGKIVGDLGLTDDGGLFLSGFHSRRDLLLESAADITLGSDPLHIGLAGRKPDFADEDILEGDFFTQTIVEPFGND